MGRAPNPGAPQRVSAHVVPKAPSFSTDDEDEKTTIESGGWEEEASTTVEQGEVADKIRALGIVEQARRANTSITSTNGGVSDEPTVDDQRGAAALAMLPPQIVARLVITQGNDSGKAIEIRPGKTYTIGRGIDNDLVLTDIAVSRKHFDLRSENGSWVLADRGSGNGTLVNRRLEDAPFMLASGDMIEIGNTEFRFDMPGMPSRTGRTGSTGSGSVVSGNGREFPSTQPGYEGSVDEDLEPSTMSGKPLNETEAATPPKLAPMVNRPKTLPPPAPQRPRTQSGRPVVGYGLERPSPPSQSQALPPLPLPPQALATAMAPTLSPMLAAHAVPIQLQPQLQTTLPLPQMANRPPLGPVALLDLPALGPAHGAQPTTIPGQGPPIQPIRPARLPFSYPSAQEIPQQQPVPNGHNSRQMAVASGPPGRDATSTALVPPMSYANGQPVLVPQPAYGAPPQLTRRMKMALAAAALAFIAAVATIAIIKGVSSGSGSSGQAPGPRPAEPRPTVEPIRDPRTIRSIDLPRASKAVAPPTPAPRTDKLTPPPTTSAPVTPAPTAPAPTAPAPAVTPAPGTSPPTASASPPTASASPPTASVPGTSAATAPRTPAATTSTAPGALAPSTPATAASPPAAPAPTAPALAVRTDKIPTPAAPAMPAPSAPSPGTPPVAPGAVSTSPAPAPARVAPAPVAPSTTTADPDAPTTAATASRNDKTNDKTTRLDAPAQTSTKGEHKTSKRPDKKSESKKTTASKSDVGHVETERLDRTDRIERTEVAPTPRTEKKHGGRTTQDVKNEANTLYRARNFSGAAALVTSSLASFTSDDAQDLKALAAVYSQLGKNYSVGMAPGTKPTDAFAALRRAINFDRDAGSAYISELQDRLINIAPRAASSYMAAKEFELAFQAVRQSESLGAKSTNNQTVRSMLETNAAELLRSAQGELASDPESAKKKLHQILGIVDSKNPIYLKAQKLLNGS